MGKRKLDIKNGDRPVNPDVSFSKRKGSIFEKAAALCVQTGAEIAVVAFSTHGNPFVFGHPSAKSVIDRYTGCDSEEERGDFFNCLYKKIQESDMSCEELHSVRDRLIKLVNEKLEKSKFVCEGQHCGLKSNEVNLDSSSGSKDDDRLMEVGVVVSEESTDPVLDYLTDNDTVPMLIEWIETKLTDGADSTIHEHDNHDGGVDDQKSLASCSVVTKGEEIKHNLGTEKDTFLNDTIFWDTLSPIENAKHTSLSSLKFFH